MGAGMGCHFYHPVTGIVEESCSPPEWAHARLLERPVLVATGLFCGLLGRGEVNLHADPLGRQSPTMLEYFVLGLDRRKAHKDRGRAVAGTCSYSTSGANGHALLHLSPSCSRKFIGPLGPATWYSLAFGIQDTRGDSDPGQINHNHACVVGD